MIAVLVAGVFMAVPSPALFSADEIPYSSGGRRDPFIPLIGAKGMLKYGSEAKSKDLVLDGIIFDPAGESLVVINGETYRQGSQIGKVAIISIFKDRVVLGQSDGEKTLWIREEIVDDPTKVRESRTQETPHGK